VILKWPNAISTVTT